ncbi:MAG: hypothetical protein H7X86_10165, partial [Gorillibacterium sp.]|nr:hypothetical protein [Gorillibacterium sp.]
TAATTTTVTGVSNWAKGWVQTALDAKLITPQTDYTKLAPRGALVDSAYLVYEAKTVATIKSAKQIGAKSIEVTFVGPVAATQTVTVKSGFLPVDGKTALNETRTVATFTTVDDLAAGTYTVGGKDLVDTTVAVVASVVTKIEFATTTVVAVTYTQDIPFKVYNQFNEVITLNNADFLNPSAYNVTKGQPIPVGAVGENKIVLLANTGIAKDDKVLVSVFHKLGVNAQATLTAVPASTISKVQFGTVVPNTGDSRITANQTNKVALPLTQLDQYGKEIALVDAEALTFSSSNPAVVNVSSILTIVKADGKYEYRFAPLADGVTTITAYIPGTTVFAQVDIKVEKAAALSSITFVQPSGLVVATEAVEIKYAGKNQYAGNVNLTAGNSVAGATGLPWFSTNPTVVPTSAIVVAADGKLTITPAAEGVATVNAYLNGQIQGTFSFDTKAAAVPTKISVSDKTTTRFVQGVTHAYAAKEFKIVDQYNRVIADDKLVDANLSIVEKTDADAILTAAGVTVTTDVAKSGTAVLTATYATKSIDFTVTTVKVIDVVSYDISAPAITTLKVSSATTNPYQFVFKANSGKDAAGNVVAVDPSVNLFSSDDSAVGVTVGGAVYGVTHDKSAVVTVFKAGKQVAQVTFKASTNASVAETVAFADNTPSAITATTTFAVVVKDQYGVAIPAVGTWFSTDASVLSIVPATGVATVVASGKATISFVTSNGKVLTKEITATK